MVIDPLELFRAVWEPVAVSAVAGGGLAWFIHKKKADHRVILIFICLVVLLFCKTIYGTGSSRYSAILLYPAILLSSYFILTLPGQLSRRIPYGFAPKKIAFLLFTCFCTVLFLKDLRFNRYSDYIAQAAMLVKQNAENSSLQNVFFLGKDYRRFEYYLGERIIGMPSSTSRNTEPADVTDVLSVLKNTRCSWFVIFNESASASPIQAKKLNLEAGEWRYVGGQFHDNRKKYRLSVYHYIPSTTGQPLKITPAEKKDFIEQNSNNLVKNGDFEHLANSIEHLWAIKHYSQRGLNSFSRSKLMLPHAWSMNGIGGFAPESQAVVELSNDRISGKYSLHMKSDSAISIYSCEFISPENYRLNFIAKGNLRSILFASVLLYTSTNRPLGSRQCAGIPIEAGSELTYSIPIRSEKIPPNCRFRILFTLEQGDILIDEVSLQPVSSKGNKRKKN